MPLPNLHNHLLRRDHTIHGAILRGLDGHAIELQGRATSLLNQRLPVGNCCHISGMTRDPVKEALTRIGGAFSKLEIGPSPVEILINLAPAALEKDGAWLDLPLAILMLQVAGMLPDLPPEQEGRFLIFGEIGIHGELRRVPGALSLAHVATPGQSLIVPAGNERECALILARPEYKGCKVYPASTLDEVLSFFRGTAKLNTALREKIRFENAVEKPIDFGRIRGQEQAKRAATIAAAGGHNLLLIGPPGEGKSMIASAIAGILPRLKESEIVELTRIYSAVGQLPADGHAVTRRPMRPVHHSVSMPALVGGGSGFPRPGEITLAHHGVLFLDELPEFSRRTLESLRQPLEEGVVTITRVHGSMKFPARFSLIAAMNPCPCGYAGTPQCSCDGKTVAAYQSKLSGPLLDRIDMQVTIQPLTIDQRFAPTNDEESRPTRDRVERAREVQQCRFENTTIPNNAAIPGGRVSDYCQFTSEGFASYKNLVVSNNISTRKADRLARVARTIADLDAAAEIRPTDVEEAASLMIQFNAE